MVMMMPSSSGEGRSSSPMEANAVAAVSVDTKLMVTAQQLKDLLSKEDSTANPLPTVTMNPLILSWACSGSWQDLELLLNSESGPSVRYNQEFLDLLTAYSSDSCIDKSASAQKASEDVEASLNQLPSVSAVSLLEGVTIEGSPALHMVATYGDVDGFLRSADIIHSKAKHLLFVQNNNGDTPLHCASRAGMLRMVSHLIGLASLDEDNTGVDKVKELLEMENKDKETALHLAVRIGNNDIVKLLMEENSELASFPKHGNSPLYLAILLEEDIIVETLYNASHMKLSYSGQNGQNALHAAVLRGTGTQSSLSKSGFLLFSADVFQHGFASYSS
jgi:hypothetical protein